MNAIELAASYDTNVLVSHNESVYQIDIEGLIHGILPRSSLPDPPRPPSGIIRDVDGEPWKYTEEKKGGEEDANRT